MRDYGEILNSMRICLNVDRDSNCLPECFGCKYITHDHHVMDMVRDAADAIEELLSAVPKWISVEERLPGQYKPVLVSYVGYNTNSLLSDMVAYRDGDGDWCWWDGYFPSGELCKVKITHWMPLPDPPKEVE